MIYMAVNKMVKEELYTHNEYEDGTEVFTIDTGLLSDSLDFNIQGDTTGYIYTPDKHKDLKVSLPKSINEDTYEYEVNNGIITVTW